MTHIQCKLQSIIPHTRSEKWPWARGRCQDAAVNEGQNVPYWMNVLMCLTRSLWHSGKMVMDQTSCLEEIAKKKTEIEGNPGRNLSAGAYPTSISTLLIYRWVETWSLDQSGEQKWEKIFFPWLSAVCKLHQRSFIIHQRVIIKNQTKRLIQDQSSLLFPYKLKLIRAEKCLIIPNKYAWTLWTPHSSQS